MPLTEEIIDSNYLFLRQDFPWGTNDIHWNLRMYNHQSVDEISYQLIKRFKSSGLYF